MQARAGSAASLLYSYSCLRLQTTKVKEGLSPDCALDTPVWTLLSNEALSLFLSLFLPLFLFLFLSFILSLYLPHHPRTHTYMDPRYGPCFLTESLVVSVFVYWYD